MAKTSEHVKTANTKSLVRLRVSIKPLEEVPLLQFLMDCTVEGFIPMPYAKNKLTNNPNPSGSLGSGNG